jgi:hypothetical protein
MPASPPDKIIVTNCDCLVKKYGAAGEKKVETAVKKLISADAARGLTTVLVDLSDAATMASYGASAIPATSQSDSQLNKVAIDKVFTHSNPRPSYLVILGSTDVIPHVPLKNPLRWVDGDDDANVPSDLPYACDADYSDDIHDFLAPARVIGRVPNVTADKDPTYLIGLLDTAAKFKSRPASDYSDYLGISAEVWKKSTSLSLDAVFINHADLKISPPDGYKWTPKLAGRLSHFINCHGAAEDPHFYGQKGQSYPVAHEAAWMSKKVKEGTILAAECCYGAELYDPIAATAAGQIAICNTYLGAKAYAVFGSTNIAYGPEASNDQADLICQYFMQQILAGPSIGRASLQSRLDYVALKAGVLRRADLKTLGQYALLGDPSVTPVQTAPAHDIAPSTAKSKRSKSAVASDRFSRLQRRAALFEQAGSTKAFRLERTTHESNALSQLRAAAGKLGIKNPEFAVSDKLLPPSDTTSAKAFIARASTAGMAPIAVHTLLKRKKPPREVPGLKLFVGLQAIEYEEGMVIQTLNSR